MMRYRLAAAAALALGACSMGQDLTSGGAAVDEFHKLLDTGQFAAIEAGASSDIKSTPGGFAPILEQVHARLGNVKSTSRTGFNDRVDNGDHRLELQYDTTFANGDGAEEFVFRMIDGKPVLAGYHVKSDKLTGNYSPSPASDAAASHASVPDNAP